MIMATAAWTKHVVDKLYTLDNTVTLWLLYPYRVFNLVSNKHTGDDAHWTKHLNAAWVERTVVEY
jgi:hypothetical protein